MNIVADPRTAPSIRWGILGAGGIASSFATAVLASTRAQVVAVGSRNRYRAEHFATRHGIPTTHEGYERLVADEQVDAIYVASPHSEHLEHALLAIRAGKHVLVEKAFTRNLAEAEQLVAAAREAGVFMMEAMWTRFLPHVAALRGAIARGEIGEVVNITADHGQNFLHLPDSHRIHNPELAGGALLDLGVYPVSFAHDLLGVPTAIQATGVLTGTGVDGHVGMTLDYPGRAIATLSTTSWAQTPTTAAITGTEGRIDIATSFYRPTSFTLTRLDGTEWTYRGPEMSNGLEYEAAEVARCIVEGRLESERMTLDDTLEVMASLDEIRRQIGVVYPGE